MTGDKEDPGTLGKTIIGRALLWTLMDGTYYMDRIYGLNDSVVKVFEKWAKDNNYTTYNYTSDKQLSVKVKPVIYSKYPYMDTFKKYNPENGKLYNDTDKDDSEGMYLLEDTDGGYTEIGTSKWSDYYDCEIPEEDAVKMTTVQAAIDFAIKKCSEIS